MTILTIETSTTVCSAAITVGGIPVEKRMNLCDGNHARQLPLFIDEILRAVAERGLNVEAVALSEGPGSYTGLRIGASTAKGLCYGLNVPLLPVPTPQVLCASFAAQRGNDIPRNALLCPMIDARRMEVYTALYNANLQQVIPIEAKIIDADSFADRLAKQPIVFFGDGAKKCQSVIKSPNAYFVDDIVPDAQYMGVLAEQMAADTTRQDIDIAYFDPLYIKEFVPAPSHVKGLN